MKSKTKLTSVNILENIYKKFKIKTVDDNLNLQKLVNRSINLYNTSAEYRKQIDNHDDLSSYDSKF